MASISQALLVAGGIIVLVGALTAGFGFYEQQSNTCLPGGKFVINHLQPNETVDAPFERDFENLSTKHQTALREQLPVNQSERIEEDALINGTLNTVVEYEGERYYIYRDELDDCSPTGRSYQIGGVTLAVGGVIVLSVFGWRKFR